MTYSTTILNIFLLLALIFIQHTFAATKQTVEISEMRVNDQLLEQDLSLVETSAGNALGMGVLQGVGAFFMAAYLWWI